MVVSTLNNGRLKEKILKFIPVIASIITSFLSILVIIGWYTHSVTLVQLLTSAPMLGNTAISFLFCSIALITLTFTPNRRYLKIGLVSSIVVLLIGLIAIFQHIFNIDLGIDQLFIKPFTNDQIVHAGRMPLVTSLCFVFLTISILSLNKLIKLHRYYFYIFIAEILTISSLIISLVSFFEHLIGASKYGGLAYTKMAIPTSICFIFLSTAILTILFNSPQENTDIKINHKMPLLVGIGSLMVCLSLWQALVTREKTTFQQTIKVQSENTKRFISSQLEDRVEALLRMVKRREMHLDMPKEEWESDATLCINHYKGLQAIEWVDSSYAIRWVVSIEANTAAQDSKLLTENNRKQVLDQAKEQHKAIFTKSFDLVQGSKVFLVCIPIYAKEQFNGFIIGIFNDDHFLNILLKTDSLQDFAINIYDNNELVYKTKDPNQNYDESLKYKTTLNQNGLNWQIEFYPSSSYISKETSSLPTLGLTVGIILSGMLSLTSYLIEIGKFRTQQILAVNQNLVNEISARKFVEENKERLLSILESTTDFIGIAKPTGQITYANRAGRVFLGLSETEDCSKFSIINVHPEEISKMIFDKAIPLAIKDGSWSGETLLKALDNKQIKVSQVLIVHKSASGEVEYISTIMRDISERIRIEEEMKTAKETAEAATQAKAEFLANMSHEIRTPMNAVIGLTGLLLDTKLDDQQRDFLETIRSSGDSLLTIINDILDFSKIESGKLSLELQPFDLRSCIEQSLDLLAARASEKGLELAYLISEDTPSTITSDITRLRQILVNLLTNAVKFTHKGEVLISVKVKEAKDNTYTLHFSVKDTGIGIAKDRQHLLFQSFSQTDSSTTRKYGGTGLGLAISKHLSELMGGTMWVESDSGQGSNFQFTIVVKSAPSEKQIYLQALQPQLAGKKILIIDDNFTNRKILFKQTQSWGMIPTSLESGLEALEQLKNGLEIDIAILDMNMPEMDGITLAIEARKIPRLKTLPLVMLSSQGHKIDNIEKEINFAANLTKPVKQSQLYDVLISIFGKLVDKQTNVKTTKQVQVENLSAKLPLRILLAEDNVINQKVALKMLKRLGYRADIASNGVEALQALTRQSYDLVLMDVQMPEMDGLEATRQICQAWPKQKRPRIIAMTAGAMQGDRDKCIEVGMDDYITKPIDMVELTSALEKTTILTKQEAKTSLEANSNHQPLKYSTLNVLAELPSDNYPNFLVELIGNFLSYVPTKLNIINEAIQADKAKELEFAAHSLLSISGTLGAEQMMKLCAEIEAIATKGSTNNTQALFVELEKEFSYVSQALETERNKFIEP